MQDNDTTESIKKPHQSHVKAIVIALLALAAVCGIGAVTALVVLPTLVKKAPDNQAQTQTKRSANDVYAAITKSGVIGALSDQAYQMQDANGIIVTVKSQDKPYSITVPATKSGVYNAVKGKETDDRTMVASQLAEVAKQQGLQAVASAVKDTQTMHFSTYQGGGVVCQLASTYIKQDAFLTANHTIGCVDDAGISAAYTSAANLLALSDAAGQKTSPTAVRTTTGGKDTVSYTVLTVEQNDKRTTLLYATVDKKSEYVANLSDGDAQYSNGKYIITPETQAKLSDAKYNGILLEQIVGKAA